MICQSIQKSVSGYNLGEHGKFPIYCLESRSRLKVKTLQKLTSEEERQKSVYGFYEGWSQGLLW